MLLALTSVVLLHIVLHNATASRNVIYRRLEPPPSQTSVVNSQYRGNEVEENPNGNYEEVCNTKSGCSTWQCCSGKLKEKVCKLRTLAECSKRGRRKRKKFCWCKVKRGIKKLFSKFKKKKKDPERRPLLSPE